MKFCETLLNMPHLMFCACCETENCHFYATFPLTGTADTIEITIPRQSRGYFLCGRSPMLPATPHAALVRLAICIGPPTHTGISPSPFPSHIAAIPNIYTFFFCLIIFHQQSLLLSHNLLNCFCHFILEWPPSVL